MKDCERCGFAMAWGEHRWVDGEEVCIWCQQDMLFTEPEEDRPPHVNHWGWEGEAVFANGTR